jgi:hypothetical protein
MLESRRKNIKILDEKFHEGRSNETRGQETTNGRSGAGRPVDRVLPSGAKDALQIRMRMRLPDTGSGWQFRLEESARSLLARN